VASGLDFRDDTVDDPVSARTFREYVENLGRFVTTLRSRVEIFSRCSADASSTT